MYAKVYIPFRGYYSTPFARWQGSLQNDNSITLGAVTAKRWLATKNYDPEMIDYVVFGKTVASPIVSIHLLGPVACWGRKRFLPCIFLKRALHLQHALIWQR